MKAKDALIAWTRALGKSPDMREDKDSESPSRCISIGMGFNNNSGLIFGIIRWVRRGSGAGVIFFGLAKRPVGRTIDQARGRPRCGAVAQLFYRSTLQHFFPTAAQQLIGLRSRLEMATLAGEARDEISRVLAEPRRRDYLMISTDTH